tara:strand:- start:45 stop:623 length:579 start_codon:yes stop_codon:yes gene_type:complete
MNKIKIAAISVGGVVAFAHIGLLGYVFNRPKQPEIPQVPTINIPNGTPYSSYKIEATRDGYSIEYKANDPAILESSKSLTLDKEKRGLFGGGSEQRTEFRRDQFTMDGTRNMGGATIGEEGKSAKDIECIVADAGARSQGAMAGSAIAAGVAVPAVSSIPYVGWLAGGWALLLGQKAGSELGSQVGTVFNDC